MNLFLSVGFHKSRQAPCITLDNNVITQYVIRFHNVNIMNILSGVALWILELLLYLFVPPGEKAKVSYPEVNHPVV